jgi:glycosyltransferase involved in cell wall biosynthesis
VFVTSSLHEGFGLPLAEAMACGTPCIGTEIGAYREIARHGEDAWLVPPRDPRALAEAIRMLWNDPALRARLADAARRRIVETFNWRNAAEQTLAVYEEVTQARRVFSPGLAAGG